MAQGKLVAAIFNKSIAGATTDFLATDITPPSVNVTDTAATPTAPAIDGQPAVAYRVTVALSAAVKLHLAYMCTGIAEVDVAFNNDVALVADTLYTFTFSAARWVIESTDTTPTACTFNFQASGACTVRYMLVEEIVGGAI